MGCGGGGGGGGGGQEGGRERGRESYSALGIVMIPPPSGLSVESAATAPPSTPPNVNAGGFFFDIVVHN